VHSYRCNGECSNANGAKLCQWYGKADDKRRRHHSGRSVIGCPYISPTQHIPSNTVHSAIGGQHVPTVRWEIPGSLDQICLYALCAAPYDSYKVMVRIKPWLIMQKSTT